MKQVELLAPAGSMEALRAAVQAGCNAVYLGGEAFGARAFASNFDHDQMIEAIRYAHRYGVKVYVTMNTLIYDQEMEEAIAYARFLYEQDVDALLIQDLGFCDRVHQELPDLELHASTQMHIHNIQGIETAKKLGIARVVVPRETTIEELRILTKQGVEVEAFVHGALCLSYSGQCLMSATLFDRSGNRGECAQPCRMRYELWRQTKNGDERIDVKGSYLLSPRDLFTLKELPMLLDAGICSLKIEGRMKKPEYVAQVVMMYRKAIDAWMKQRPVTVDENELHALSKLFSRGFTDGHAFQAPGRAMMNPFRPNHQGVVLGKVIKVSNHRIRIRLQEDLHQGDGIRILGKVEDEGCIINRLYIDGKLASSAKANQVIEIDRKVRAEKDAVVQLTSDRALEKKLQQMYQDVRRIKVSIHVAAKAGEPLQCEIRDEEGFYIEAYSESPVQAAQKAPMSEETLKHAFAQLGDTPFELDSFTCRISDACFMNVAQIKNVRRKAIEQLSSLRERRHSDRQQGVYHRSYHDAVDPRGLFACVETLQQYQACKDAGIHDIVTDRYSLFHQLQAKGEAVGFHEGNIVKTKQDAAMGGENGALSMKRMITDATLNLTNKEAVSFVSSCGISTMVLSLEHDLVSIQALCAAFQQEGKGMPDMAVMIYGYRDLMISKVCVINTYAKDGTKKDCSLCRLNRYYLKDQKGRIFPLNNDENCNMRILNERADDQILRIPFYRQQGIRSFYLRFTIETAEETKNVLKRVKRTLEMGQ